MTEAASHAVPGPHSLERRVDRLEWRVDAMADHSTRINTLEDAEVGDGVRISSLEAAFKRVEMSNERLGEKIEKLYWAAIGLAGTVASSAVGLAIQQYLAARGGK